MCNERKIIKILLYILVFCLLGIIVTSSQQSLEVEAEENEIIETEVELLEGIEIEDEVINVTHITEVSYIKTVTRSDTERIKPKYEILNMEITAYTAGYESTKKTPSHPEYGITASGNKVKEHYTIAASREIPFGTRIRIPDYEEFMGIGETIFVVEDRGSAITEGKMDIYIEDLKTALKWGRRKETRVIIYLD